MAGPMVNEPPVGPTGAFVTRCINSFPLVFKFVVNGEAVLSLCEKYDFRPLSLNLRLAGLDVRAHAYKNSCVRSNHVTHVVLQRHTHTHTCKRRKKHKTRGLAEKHGSRKVGVETCASSRNQRRLRDPHRLTRLSRGRKDVCRTPYHSSTPQRGDELGRAFLYLRGRQIGRRDRRNSGNHALQ